MEISPTPPFEDLFGPQFQHFSEQLNCSSIHLSELHLFEFFSGKDLLDFSFISDRILKKCFSYSYSTYLQ